MFKLLKVNCRGGGHGQTIAVQDGDVGRSVIFWLVDDSAVELWIIVRHGIVYLQVRVFGIGFR